MRYSRFALRLAVAAGAALIAGGLSGCKGKSDCVPRPGGGEAGSSGPKYGRPSVGGRGGAGAHRGGQAGQEPASGGSQGGGGAGRSASGDAGRIAGGSPAESAAGNAGQTGWGSAGEGQESGGAYASSGAAGQGLVGNAGQNEPGQAGSVGLVGGEGGRGGNAPADAGRGGQGQAGSQAGAGLSEGGDTGAPSPVPAGGASGALPLACENVGPALRNNFETRTGFSGRAAFAFDAQGSLVTVDRDGDLVRRDAAGREEVWVPALSVPYGALDLAFLPNGDLAVVDATGALLTVTPIGATDGIISGLSLPARLGVDGDDTVFISEEEGGRIREVNLTTGGSTVIAAGLTRPGDLTFSPTSATLYCASRSSGIVYALDRDAQGRWGAVREFARTPYAPGDPRRDICRGKTAGDACEDYASGFVCQERAGELSCEPRPVCENGVGEPCTTQDGLSGTCQDLGGQVECAPVDPCVEASEGTPCVDGTGTDGVCALDPWRDRLYCALPGACFFQQAGEPCEIRADYFYYGPVYYTGVCSEDAAGRPICDLSAVDCLGKAAGDTCRTEDETLGTCVDPGAGAAVLTCEENPPDCLGRAEGDPCVDEYGAEGECVSDYGELVCDRFSPCEGQSPDDACIAYDGNPGICIGEVGDLYCEPTGPCDGLEPGAPCETDEGPGSCMGPPGDLYCEPVGPCDGLDPGAPCETPWGARGVCLEDYYYEGVLYCEEIPPCEGLSAGDECVEWGDAGICTDDGSGYLYCRQLGVCDVLSEGAPCVEWRTSGVCTDVGGYLECREVSPCQGLSEGDACAAPAEGTWDPYYDYYDYYDYERPSEDRFVEGRCEVVDDLCTETCVYTDDGECDDGGPNAITSICEYGTDCTDCGPRSISPSGGAGGAGGSGGNEGGSLAAGAPPSPGGSPSCTDTCNWPDDGECDDGGPGAITDLCEYGTDCTDCGPRPGFGSGGSSGAGGAGTAGDLAVAGLPGAGGTPGTGGSAGGPPEAGGELGLAGTEEQAGALGTGFLIIPVAGTTGSGGGPVATTGLWCVPVPPCESKEAGDPCVTLSGLPGLCEESETEEGGLACEALPPCYGLPLDAPCELLSGASGVCRDSLGTGALECEPDNRVRGQLGALAQDACGYVYVAEDSWGRIWRIAPDASAVELVTELPAQELSDAAWGVGEGGWETNSLYFIEPNRSTLYGIPIGASNEADLGT